MAKKPLTDEQVEQEIQRLLQSPHVKLAKKEEQVRMRRRRYLYDLRCLEKKGRELESAGITLEMLQNLGDGDYDYAE